MQQAFAPGKEIMTVRKFQMKNLPLLKPPKTFNGTGAIYKSVQLNADSKATERAMKKGKIVPTFCNEENLQPMGKEFMNHGICAICAIVLSPVCSVSPPPPPHLPPTSMTPVPTPLDNTICSNYHCSRRRGGFESYHASRRQASDVPVCP